MKLAPADTAQYFDFVETGGNPTVMDSRREARLRSAGRLPADEAPHPLQVKAWREMGASGRSQMGIELRRKVRQWKTAALRAQHKDWPEEHLRRELAKLYLRGST